MVRLICNDQQIVAPQHTMGKWDGWFVFDFARVLHPQMATKGRVHRKGGARADLDDAAGCKAGPPLHSIDVREPFT
jgi:hypothetical protein